MERFGEQYGWPLGVLPWLATLYAETGDHLAARQMLDRVIASLDDLPQNAELIPSLCFVADAIHCLGDDQAAALVYPRLARYGHLFAVDGIAGSCTGSVSRQLGHLAALLGRAGDAVAHYERAVEANVRGGADFYAARARQDLERCRQPANPAAPATPAPASPAAFVAEGSVWRLSYDGATVTMPDAKGLHDLAWLLAHPGKEIAAADLMGLDATTTLPAGDDTLDDRARTAYRRRLAELEDDLAEAEDHHDVERAARAREERDFLAAELAAALGLGGRARRLGDPSERARKAVTMRIRNSIGRMAKVHPVLARHLDRSVRTGAFCCYEPERPVEWRL
jgi:tetratricopeptide (TPR) repeat protein